jgi:hypothetical protein
MGKNVVFEVTRPARVFFQKISFAAGAIRAKEDHPPSRIDL